MKIREVKSYRLGAALAEPSVLSQAWYERRGAMLVEIVGEGGLSGWGEALRARDHELGHLRLRLTS